jgi:glycosyltransferase involved in cell wall biosynthesis
MPFISICIPAYKNKKFLERLLHSIVIQTFKDFEVIVSDDSPTNELELTCRRHAHSLAIRYYKNDIPLGTPENWNNTISKASGKWIKLMHHDDWFVNEESLKSFADKALNNSAVDFIFSGYFEVQDKGSQKKYTISNLEEVLLRKNSLSLFKRNFIGSPSTTLIRNDRKEWYDKRIKWVVDFEYYIRCLRRSDFTVIKKPLINIGIHNDQVTKVSFRKPEVEIPENLYLLNKLGENSLENFFVYDYYWRLFRNLEIRNLNQIRRYSDIELPSKIIKMLNKQFKISLSILKVGVLSKICMTLSKMFS